MSTAIRLEGKKGSDLFILFPRFIFCHPGADFTDKLAQRRNDGPSTASAPACREVFIMSLPWATSEKRFFAGEEELEKFVGYLPEWITRCRLRLHGYVMMTNVPLELGQNLKGQMVLRDEKTVTEVQARLAGDRTRDVLLWLARRYAGLKLTELGALAGGLDYRSARPFAIWRKPKSKIPSCGGS